MYAINRRLVNFLCRPEWRVILFLLFFSQGLAAIASVDSEATLDSTLDNQLQENIRSHLEQIILTKLEFYATQFPDINFIILDSAADTSRNIQALAEVIGKNPVPLDYEHPEDLSNELLMVTLGRIEYFLTMEASSSTLFRPGKNAIAKRKAVCVVTMSPWAVAKDDRAATRHLLEVSDPDFEAISPKKYLDHISHLQFLLDHEIYHCLDSYYNGPIPMSQHEQWSGYNMRKNELGADAFASEMNIATHGRVTPYIRTLKNIRSLALLSDDPDHYTYHAIETVQQLDPLSLAQSDVKERFQIATTIRTRINGSYDDYVCYTRAFDSAARRLTGLNEKHKLTTKKIDGDLVKLLISDTRRAYVKLFGREILPDK